MLILSLVFKSREGIRLTAFGAEGPSGFLSGRQPSGASGGLSTPPGRGGELDAFAPRC